jgi:hypothetical protein
MPHSYDHSHVVNNQRVGFSIKHFAHIKAWVACFRAPDGRRLQRSTNETRKGAALEEAQRLIEREYVPPLPIAAKVTWRDAEERLRNRLQTSGNRPTTAGYYLKLLRLVKTEAGPDDITPAVATAWRDRIMSTPGRRKKRPSAHYVASLLGGLSALWQKWFIQDLKILTENPWKDVEPPKTDKLSVKYATDDMIEQFYAWIAERFGDWPFPKLFGHKSLHRLPSDGPLQPHIAPAA